MAASALTVLKNLALGVKHTPFYGSNGMLCLANRQYKKVTSADLSALNLNDVGRLYEVSKEDVSVLDFKQILPPKFKLQMDTLDECVWLFRRQTLEAMSCMKIASPTVPSLRAVFWGKWGTGKSISLLQVIHCAHKQGWINFTIPNAMDIMRKVYDVNMSSYCDGRIDFPQHAVLILKQFKQMNSPYWDLLKECKTQKHYKWSNVEETESGKPITDIVEIGIFSPSLASDCVGGLLRELKMHCTAGKFHLLVAIDNANSLYGKTLVKGADNKYVDPADLTLVHHLRKLFRKDWKNGICFLVADKREISDARDHLTIALNTPLELFAENIENIEPFLPIETTLYTKEEMDALYEYYKEKKWIASQKGRTERAKKELRCISGGNPYYYERLCAFI